MEPVKIDQRDTMPIHNKVFTKCNYWEECNWKIRKKNIKVMKMILQGKEVA